MDTIEEREEYESNQDNERPGRRGRKSRVENNGDMEEIEGGVPSDLFDKLQEWLDTVNCDESEIKAILYKYDHPTTGNSKSQICQWINEIPETHQIGLLFGSGRYLLYVNVPKLKKYKAVNFKIHAYYDELRKKESAQNQYGNTPILINQAPANNSMNSMEGAFSMIERMMSIMLPLIAAKQNQPDPLALMTGVYSGVNKIMQRNLIETQQLMNEMQRNKLTPSMDESEEGEYFSEGATMPEKTPSLIEQIAPLIQQFLPVLIGNSPKAQVMANTVKALPQFQQAVNNPDELKKIVAHLTKTQGKEKTERLLKRLNVKMPEGVSNG